MAASHVLFEQLLFIEAAIVRGFHLHEQVDPIALVLVLYLL